MRSTLKRAAGPQGCTMADFVVSAVEEAAHRAQEFRGTWEACAPGSGFPSSQVVAGVIADDVLSHRSAGVLA